MRAEAKANTVPKTTANRAGQTLRLQQAAGDSTGYSQGSYSTRVKDHRIHRRLSYPKGKGSISNTYLWSSESNLKALILQAKSRWAPLKGKGSLSVHLQWALLPVGRALRCLWLLGGWEEKNETCIHLGFSRASWELSFLLTDSEC